MSNLAIRQRLYRLHVQGVVETLQVIGVRLTSEYIKAHRDEWRAAVAQAEKDIEKLLNKKVKTAA